MVILDMFGEHLFILEKYCDIPLSTRKNHYVLNTQLYV